MTNCDVETGIAYGVVHMHSLDDFVWDELYANGRNLSEEDALEEWRASHPDADEEDEQDFWHYLEIEEPHWIMEIPEEGLKLEVSWLGGAPTMWVIKSPHTTRVRQCSPCCPGAGDLDSPDPDGMECYTLPADWFYREI